MNLTFHNHAWLAPLALGAIALIALAWRSWAARPRPARGAALGVGLRGLGIIIIALALADPRWIHQRPKLGANAVAILADNSEGMQVADSDETLSRGERMRLQLIGGESGWIQELESMYPVRNYRFDRSLIRTPHFQALDFAGDRSNLYGALRELRDRSSGDPPIAIALFTDGIASDEEPTVADLAGLPPVFPIVAGSDDAPRDIAIASLTASESAFEDAPLRARGSVTANGFDDQPIELTLRELGPETDRDNVISTRIQPRDDGSATPFQLDWPSGAGGLRFFELVAQPVSESPDGAGPSEATLRNNRRLMVSHVGSERRRILYVSGRPNWEFKFLNRALADDPQIDLVGLIRVANREPKFEFKGRGGESSNPLFRGFGREDETERYDQPVLVRLNTRDEAELRGGFPQTAEELFAYDAVILDDLEAGFFTYAQQGLLRDFVSERGGGLLALGGADSLEDGDYGRSAFAAALPIIFGDESVATPADLPASFHLTREGWIAPWLRLRSNESDEQLRLNQMPGFSVVNTFPRLKPAAQILAVVESGSGERKPALVTQTFGAGRVACFALGDLWSWGMRDAARRQDLDTFWRQMSRWLVSESLDRVSLAAETLAGKGVHLRAVARGANYIPIESGRARLTIERIDLSDTDATDGGFVSSSFDMSPIAGKSGHFEATVPLLDEGAYRASVTVTGPGSVAVGSAESGWVSEPAVAEYASLISDRSRLERIAAATGGQVLSYAELATFKDQLVRLPAQRSETVSLPVWHSGWIFAAAAACFLGEWALRRRKGLA